MRMIVLACLLVACVFAQDDKPQQPAEAMVMQSIHWRVNEKLLCADIVIGHADADGNLLVERFDDPYCIDPAKGEMTYRGVTKKFEGATAARHKAALQHVLQTLTDYMEDSVAWFHQDDSGKLKASSTSGNTGEQAPVTQQALGALTLLGPTPRGAGLPGPAPALGTWEHAFGISGVGGAGRACQ